MGSEAILLRSSPFGEAPIDVQRQRSRDGKVVRERDVVDHRAENLGEEDVEEDVEEGHGTVQQSLQQEAEMILFHAEVEVKVFEGHLRATVRSSNEVDIKLSLSLHPKSGITRARKHDLAGTKSLGVAELIGDGHIEVHVNLNLGAINHRNMGVDRLRGDSHIVQIQAFVALGTITTRLGEFGTQSGQSGLGNGGDNQVEEVGHHFIGDGGTEVGVGCAGGLGIWDLLLAQRGTNQETQKQETHRGRHHWGNKMNEKKKNGKCVWNFLC